MLSHVQKLRCCWDRIRTDTLWTDNTRCTRGGRGPRRHSRRAGTRDNWPPRVCQDRPCRLQRGAARVGVRTMRVAVAAPRGWPTCCPRPPVDRARVLSRMRRAGVLDNRSGRASTSTRVMENDTCSATVTPVSIALIQAHSHGVRPHKNKRHKFTSCLIFHTFGRRLGTKPP